MLAKISERTIIKIVFGVLILIAGIPLQLSLSIMTDDHFRSARQSFAPPAPLPPTINVALGKNSSLITGLDKRRRDNGHYDEHIWFGEDRDVQIELPSGRQLYYQTYNGFVSQDNDIVSLVRVKLMNVNADYLEAINNLETELINLSEKSRQNCAVKLNEIRSVQSTKTFDTKHVGCYYEIENGIELIAGVQSSSNFGAGKQIWFSFLEFSLSKDEK